MRLSKDGLLNIMRLTAKGEIPGQYARVSKPVWRLVEAVPAELIHAERNEDGSGFAGLTAEGRTVLKWDDYFKTLPKQNQP